jgi:hypothetical protein
VTAPNFAPGTAVAGKFTVRGLLGYGGVCATFHAVTREGREVALKVYSAAVGQRPDIMGQLQQYVAATNALPQDLVAPILEAGYDPATASPYTVTELIPFPSIAQLVSRRPMAMEEVGAVMRTLAAVLDAAHTRDVLHLGIKPTNIFVDPNAPGNLKVTDFGVSTARSAMPTQEGYLVAAPWMAPEQVQPGLPLGAAADIFSAALVAFFALVGRPYWRSCQGAPDLAAWQRELLSPRAPASARAAELGIPLGPALDQAFARALAIDPRERFRAMGELATAFGGFPMGAGQAQTLAFPSPAGAYAPEPPAARPQMPGAAAPSGGYPPVDALHPPAAPPQPELPPSALQTQVPMPAIMAGPGAPRTTGGRAMPIVVGAVAVLLAGGAAAAWYLIGQSTGPGPVAATSASTDAPLPPPSGSQAAPPASSAGPEPATSASAPAPDAGAPDAGANEVPVTITCKPEACEKITVNNKPVESGELRLKPGLHRIGVTRAGYFSRAETIKVEAGKPIEKEFQLTAIPRGPTGPTKKDCGKFLKRCK